MSAENPPVKFDIYDGNELVQTEVLADRAIKIGKLSSSHIRLADDTVSRMHAVVEVHGEGEVLVLDLGSDNGTWVNGERVTRQQLNSGDRITIGRFTLIVTLAQAKQAAGQSRPGARPTVQNVPLFDEEEAPGGERALEVLVMWGRTVTDVCHFASPGTYVIGDDEGVHHYADSTVLPQSPFPLAETDGSLMVVNVPDGAQGAVMLDGQEFSLDELRQGGKLSKGSMAGTSSLRLPPRGRCRLQIGQLVFLINSVPAAQQIGPAPLLQTLDPQFLKFLFTAAALHALVFLLVLSIPASADQLGLDGFNMDDRFVEFILKPDEERQERLADLFKDVKEEGEQSKKAKDESGKMGDKNEDQKDRRMAIEGPEDNKAIELARERAREEARDAAQNALNQVDAQLSAVWGTNDRAIGNDAVNALGNLTGNKVGAASGFGGLGLAGSGRGGGGLGNSIGVGNVGTYGRGAGKSGYGRGASRLGSRKAKVPKVIPGKPIVAGGLSKEIIRRVIRRHRKEYRYCYERELQTKRDLNGKIKVKFVISGQGKVIAAQIAESTMGNPNVENCLVRKVKRWIFPQPKGGGIVTVRYPFIFKSS